MTVVVDASALLALGLDEPAARVVERQFGEWIATGEPIVAPVLAVYEVFSGITRRAVTDSLTLERTPSILDVILGLPIRYDAPVLSRHETVSIAVRLERSSAYDAAYIALAESLRAELWTLDGPLSRNARSIGYHVRLFS
jgi:predicted nucleic acid-binding protein